MSFDGCLGVGHFMKTCESYVGCIGYLREVLVVNLTKIEDVDQGG